ncbi:MAG: iron-sulfur cluster assembly scaffold protein [Erythrobacter sp.]
MTLYTPAILALAAELADYPLTGQFSHRASARSRMCGSVIDIALDCDASGAISRVGLQLAACAMGQASAAIMAAGIKGRTAPEIAAVHNALQAWLAGEGTLPEWPQIDLLVPALPHKGRHGALLLPWTAALEALSSAEARR